MTDTAAEPRALRIVRLAAENLMRIEAVEIVPDPDGALVIVAGRNGQGKTSVLNAIWLALGGGDASRAIARAIRDGEDEASVRLQLGDLRVVRTWKRDKNGDEKSTLKVESADGTRKYDSPQKMLDALVGRLSFDPLAFANLPQREQVSALLSIVPFDLDFDDVAAQRRALFDERTVAGREVKNIEGELAALVPQGDDVPDDEVSTADLLAELREAQAAHDRHAQVERDRERLTGEVERLRDELDRAERALADLPAADEPANLPDLAAMDERIASVDVLNAKVRTKKARRAAEDRLGKARKRADDLTQQIADLDAAKEQALREADMPIDGLAFDDDGVTYNGVPFKQCSAAEQLRVSVAMAMALNPTVRVIRITDGSLLDANNMRLIEDMAGERGFQCWIERVSDDGAEVGIVIEDGKVKARRK